MTLVVYDARPPRAEFAAPFELVPENPKGACLLLHGFACSPHTMRSLGARLSRAGYHVYAPLLPGHGESLYDFNQVQVEDWLEAALASFDYLQRDHQTIAVAGFSMGGTLGMQLAARRPVEDWLTHV